MGRTARRVRCSVCGKILRGRPYPVRGYTVYDHPNDVTKKPCTGSTQNNHQPVENTPKESA